MTMLLTFNRPDPDCARLPSWLLALAAAALIAGAPPASACEKKANPVLAGGAAPTPITAVFTGELANGVPVYRLPSINIVGHRPEIAKTQRDAAPARATRSRPSSVAAPLSTSRNVANAARETNALKPCIG